MNQKDHIQQTTKKSIYIYHIIFTNTNSKNTTTTTTTTVSNVVSQPVDNPFADNLLDDIRNYGTHHYTTSSSPLAFDDFAFYDESAFTTMTRRPPPPPPAAPIRSDPTDSTEDIKVEKIAEPKEKKADTLVSILGRDVALPFDRLFLNHLLDADDHWFESLMAVALATTCAYLGFRLSPFFHEFPLVMLWYIVACAQYSLLKSPQPGTLRNFTENSFFF